MSEKYWEQTFKIFNSAGNWLLSADKLKYCAELLFTAYLKSCQLPPEEQAQTEDTGIAVVATLLYGLAMETILKAALLKEGIAKVDADGRVSWNTGGAKEHDLLSICRSSNLVSLNSHHWRTV